MKSNTLVLVLVAVLLGGGVYFFERHQAQQPESEEVAATPLFMFAEDEVQSLEITTPTQTLKFKKGSSGPSSWQLEAPEAGPADEAAVLFLVNLLATSQSDRTLEVPAKDRKEFGLQPPTATVMVKLQNNQTHTLVLGEKDYREKYVYAQVDPPTEKADSLSVGLVPTTFLDAIARPLSEWKYDPSKTQPAN